MLLPSIIGSAGIAVAALATTATAQCTREKLLSTAQLYVASQVGGAVSADLQALLSSNVTYRLNNKASTLAAGLLTKALKNDHSRSIADTTACASYTELISTSPAYVVGTQIRHTADGEKVAAIDVVAATTGSWLFNVARTLEYVKPESWEVLPEEKRTTREILKAAGDAYLDMWSNGTAINAVPWGTPCARTEGGMHVTPDCRAGAPSGSSGGGFKIGDRRYVIDEMIGSIDIQCAFGSMPDSHEFRLESGKVRMVHTITV